MEDINLNQLLLSFALNLLVLSAFIYEAEDRCIDRTYEACIEKGANSEDWCKKEIKLEEDN